ncbi:MAG: hypothetical protein HY541_04895 [Deltaproteobacteria bacterium]|nr:hypothetical protein [Deltaproteobacteria bacterium]
MSELTAEQKGNIKFHLGMGEGAEALTPLMSGETPELKAEQAKAVSDCYTATLNADQCLDDLAAGRLGGAGLALTEDQRKAVADCLTLGLGVDRIAEVIANGSTDPAVQTRAKETAGQIYGRYLATGDVQKALEAVGGSQGAGAVSPLTYPDDIKKREEEAVAVCQDFLNDLAARHITFTGNLEEDKERIKTEWKNYRERTNHDKKTIGLADQYIARWLNTAAKFPSIGWLRLELQRGHLQLPFGLLFAAIGLFGEISYLGGKELPSDNPILVAVFALAGTDMAGVNEDLGEPIDLREALLGIIGQLYTTSFADRWLETLPPSSRELGKSVFCFVAMLGLIQSLHFGNKIIGVSWPEQYQYEGIVGFKPMVEQLMRYLFSHPDIGFLADAYHQMPNVGSEYSPYQNVASILFRGGLAALIVMDASQNGRFMVEGGVGEYVVGTPDPSASTSFQTTALYLGRNDQAKGFAGLTNDALFMTDLIVQTTSDILKAAGQENSPLKYITPPMALALVTGLFGLLVTKQLKDNPGKALDAASLSELLQEKYVLNMTEEELTAAAQESANDTFWAIFLGGVEGMAAGYSKNRRAVVDAFARVNQMAGRDSTLVYTAAESAYRFEESGQGEGDQYKAITDTMGFLGILNTVTCGFAGIEAGSAAALSNGKDVLAYAPVVLGLIVNIKELVDAYQTPKEGEIQAVGHKQAVNGEWSNFFSYIITSAISYLISRWIDRPLKLEMTFDKTSGRYRIVSTVRLNPGGLSMDGRFGPVSAQESAIAREISQKERLLRQTEEEQAVLLAGEIPSPNGADSRYWHERRAMEFDGEITALREDLIRLKGYADMSPSQIAVDQALTSQKEVLERLTAQLDGVLSGEIGPPPGTSDPEKWISDTTHDLSGQIFRSQSELLTIVAGQVEAERDAVGTLLMFPVPYDSGNELHRVLLAEEILPDLRARRKEIVAQLDQVGRDREIHVEKSPYGPASLYGLKFNYEPPTEEQLAEIRRLTVQRDNLDAQIVEIEHGYGLAELYQQKTGIDVRLAGMNPVFKEYQQELEKQKTELMAFSNLLEEISRA